MQVQQRKPRLLSWYIFYCLLTWFVRTFFNHFPSWRTILFLTFFFRKIQLVRDLLALGYLCVYIELLGSENRGGCCLICWFTVTDELQHFLTWRLLLFFFLNKFNVLYLADENKIAYLPQRSIDILWRKLPHGAFFCWIRPVFQFCFSLSVAAFKRAGKFEPKREAQISKAVPS